MGEHHQNKPLLYGGQAVIEGVMMRGPRHAAVAVRRADGTIRTQAIEAVPWLTRHPRWNIPFLRGPVALFDSLRLGVWGLKWSAAQAMEDAVADEAAKKDAGTRGRGNADSRDPGFSSPSGGGSEGAASGSLTEPILGEGEKDKPGSSGASDAAIQGTMGLGLLIGVGLFIALPTLLAGPLKSRLGTTGLNVVEGVIRLALFFGYLRLIALLPGIRRVFEFHGAEHRVINALESGAPMTPDGVRGFAVVHPRCGTSFAIFVLLLATVVYTFFGWHVWWLRLLVRLALLPLIAGAAYELLKLAGRLRGNTLLEVVTWPGRFSQRFTTREPDDAQTEVAIAALQAVQEAEHAEAPVLA
jgi:uncharacterized protein YqhQ